MQLYKTMAANLGKKHFILLLLGFVSCFLLGNYVRQPTDQPTIKSPSKTRETRNFNELFQMLRYTRSQLSHATKERLGNFSEFEFEINSAICKDDTDIDMLFLIGSHPSHRHLRDVFRQFFNNPNIPQRVFKVVFLFGHLENQTQQDRLLEESRKHKDIVQGNFKDSYYNVTLRDLMGFRWTWRNCPQTRFITRMDDDVAIDIYTLLNSLHLCCSNMLVFIGCYTLWHNAPVKREGRYGIRIDEHPSNVFEDYCAGWMYVITPLMAYLLDWATEHTPYYWMNDAYITGSLVKVLGLKHVTLHFRNTDNIQLMREMLNLSNSTRYIIGPTEANVNFTRELLQFFYHDKRNNKKT